MIVSTRYLRRGLRASLRAGIELGEISRHSSLSAPQLQLLLDGGYPWATPNGAEAVLAGLPPAVERAVRAPTFALRVDCRTGSIASSMLSETVQRLVGKHGLVNTGELLGLSPQRMKAIFAGKTSVTFAIADRILTLAGEAIRWHTDAELRRAYWSYSDVPLCLVNGHRPPLDWKRKPKRELVAA